MALPAPFSLNSQSGKIPDRGGLFIIILQNTYVLEVISNKNNKMHIF
jgi:hypothetical protein